MNRRERRAMERMSQREFQKIKNQTLKQLQKQFPDRNFTKQEIDESDEKLKNIIEQIKNTPANELQL
jgi:hypothetical protein